MFFNVMLSWFYIAIFMYALMIDAHVRIHEFPVGMSAKQDYISIVVS